MKEVKEEIKREIVDTHIHYEAIDGTYFQNKEECEKYENTAFCVLLSRAKTFALTKENDTPNPLDESEENIYLTLLPKTSEDINTINQLYLLTRSGDTEDVPFSDEYINKLILMGYRMYDNKLEWTWFYTLDKVIANMTGDTYMLVPKK